MKTKKMKLPPKVEVLVKPAPLPAKEKQKERIVKTYHPRFGYIERKVKE